VVSIEVSARTDAVSTARGPDVAVVIPTVARRSLLGLVDSLLEQGAALHEVVIVDDRPLSPFGPAVLYAGRPRLRRLWSGGTGPAAARNLGWRATDATWVAFLDDDVELPPDWVSSLVADLEQAPDDVVAVQGRVVVPVDGPRPTDWERQTRGLESAQWATADMAYRRQALLAVGGFDERFRRAYREDADLGLRTSAVGRIVSGTRAVNHPVRAAQWWVSIARQRGNADDALMARRHGPDWRTRAGAPHGAFRSHVVATTALLTAGALTMRRSRWAFAPALVWLGSATRFAWKRIEPGPRDRREVATMVVTSLVIPPVAVWWRVHGEVAVRRRAGTAHNPR
jgi:GT2 family glycosyltransferase